MATPRLVSIRDFNTSIYSQLGETSTANMSDVLVRAEQTIERKLKRPIYPTSYTESYYPKSNKLYLKNRPIIAVQSLSRSYLEGTTPSVIAPTSYRIEAEEGILYSTVALNGYFVQVTYTAGFTETPEDIKQAILMQAAMFAFQDLEFYGAGDAKNPGIRYVIEDIESLLAPYKQLNVAYTESYQW
jgi:hypothetical protein